MIGRNSIRIIPAAMALSSLGLAGASKAADTLPFTVTLEEIDYQGTAPPALQSYTSAVLEDGRWLVMAGRTVGLHTFNAVADQADPTKGNFPPDSSNHEMLVIDPH